MYGCTSPEAQVEHAELEALVVLAVASLALMCRWVFLMVPEDDASYAATALAFGISRDTVKEQLMAAQRHLPAARVDAGVIAPPVPLACPPRVTETPNDVTAQPVDAAANRQDSAACRHYLSQTMYQLLTRRFELWERWNLP